MIDVEEIKRVNYAVDNLVRYFSIILKAETGPTNFTRSDLHEFIPLFLVENFVKLLKKKSLDNNIVVITEFKEDQDFVISIMFGDNFLQLMETPEFNKLYNVIDEEKSSIKLKLLENKIKLN